jgi:hypothetical protein
VPEGVKRPEDPAPPPGEPVHLPGPSYLPVLTAAGVTVAVTGIVISIPIAILGAIVAAVAVWRWVGQTREEISELPLEH